MAALTLPQAKKYLLVSNILLLAVTIMFVIQSNGIFGFKIYEETKSLDYDQGRTVAIMDIYPSPEQLYQALENGDIQFDMLTPELKQLYEFWLEKQQ